MDGRARRDIAYERTFERTAPSMAVVEAVARVVDCDPIEVESLYERLDPDALDALFGAGREDPTVGVSFELNGHPVLVDGDGITVFDSDS